MSFISPVNNNPANLYSAGGMGGGLPLSGLLGSPTGGALGAGGQSDAISQTGAQSGAGVIEQELQMVIQMLMQLIQELMKQNGTGGQQQQAQPPPPQQQQSQPQFQPQSAGGTGGGGGGASGTSGSSGSGNSGWNTTPTGASGSSGTPSSSGTGTSSGAAGSSGSSGGPTASLDAAHTTAAGGKEAVDTTGNTSNDPLKGKVDPNKPIYIKQNADGSYNGKALEALGKQGYGAAGTTEAGAKADNKAHSGDAGEDGGTWSVANGWAKGITYGAASLTAAHSDGYDSLQDQKYAVTQAAVETGADGSLSGRREHTQAAGTGVGTHGQGPAQLDSQWHDQTGANNPFVAFTRAWEVGNTINGGHSTTLKGAGLAYNSGNPGETEGQNEVRGGQNISYGDYWDSLVKQL